MSEILMWSLLAFFGAFGVIEFVRFIYTDWKGGNNDYHIVVSTKNKCGNIESVVRNTILSTNARSLLVIDDSSDETVRDVLGRLAEKYTQIEVLTSDEYIDFLHSKEC